MKLAIGGLAGVLLLALALAGPVEATTVIYASPQDLGSEADIVVLGRVESTESYWNEGRTTILTRTRIAVEQAYKGPAPATVEIIQVGGIVGPVIVNVQGACTWMPGEEVVLFAEAHDANCYVVSGFSQGKFSVVRDSRTGDPIVRSPRVDGVRLLGAPGGKGQRPALGPGVL